MKKLNSMFIKRWYFPRYMMYQMPDPVKAKMAENFLHWIKGEPQTDMQGNPIPPEELIMRV